QNQTQSSSAVLPQAAQKAESRSSLATRLPKTDLVEKSRDAGAAPGRKHGSFAVNSRRRERHEGQNGGMLWVDRVGDRRSQAILARSFSLETQNQQIRTVELNQALGGLEGAQVAAPSPHTPQPCSYRANAMFCSTATTKRGHF